MNRNITPFGSIQEVGSRIDIYEILDMLLKKATHDAEARNIYCC